MVDAPLHRHRRSHDTHYNDTLRNGTLHTALNRAISTTDGITNLKYKLLIFFTTMTFLQSMEGTNF